VSVDGGGARASGAAAERWIDRQHSAGDERLETGAVVLDGALPVTRRAAPASLLELVRRQPRTCK